MSADLDELLGALGRHADSVPLGGADAARQRGQRRTRARAVATAAVAVVLVAVGVGVTLHDPQRKSAPATTPTPLDGRPIPEVGRPVDLGGTAAHSAVATDGERAYVASIKAADKSLRLRAADLEAGVPAWDAAQPIVDPQRALDQVIVVPSAVLVVTRAHNGTTPAVGLFAFDPLTGAPLWTKESEENDALVFGTDMLVHLSAATGRVDGFDWVAGTSRWSRTTGDRPVRAIGMAIPDDDVRINQTGPPPTFGSGRLVLVTDRGRAEVLETATGRVLRTVPVGARSGDTMVAYDGWLLTHDDDRVWATDLSGDAGTEPVHEVAGQLVALTACGRDRACVLTESSSVTATSAPISTVTALDVRRRQTVWKATSRAGPDRMTSAGGATVVTGIGGALELYSSTGKLLHVSVLNGGWLDGKNLLVAMPDGTGRLARLSAAGGRLTPYGRHVGVFSGYCTSTSVRLACADDTVLRIWRIG